MWVSLSVFVVVLCGFDFAFSVCAVKNKIGINKLKLCFSKRFGGAPFIGSHDLSTKASRRIKHPSSLQKGTEAEPITPLSNYMGQFAHLPGH